MAKPKRKSLDDPNTFTRQPLQALRQAPTPAYAASCARARKPFRFRPPCVGSPAVAKGSAPGRNGTDGGEPREGEGETGAWKVKLYVFVNV